jgi:hypothetical protein
MAELLKCSLCSHRATRGPQLFGIQANGVRMLVFALPGRRSAIGVLRRHRSLQSDAATPPPLPRGMHAMSLSPKGLETAQRTDTQVYVAQDYPLVERRLPS